MLCCVLIAAKTRCWRLRNEKWLSMIAEKMARVLKIASPLIVDPKKKIIAEVVAEVLDDDKDKKQDSLS